MEIVAKYSQIKRHFGDRPPLFEWDEGGVFELLSCPACEKINVQHGYYHSEHQGHYQPIVIWPQEDPKILGLPERVQKAFEAANKVKNIDTNAFAVLLRRLLEIVCLDREAEGRTLNDQLADLARKGELPDRLVGMAGGLRRMGNIGAHASAGELGDMEVPYLEALCRAILEYLYHAPMLLEKVKGRLEQIK